jgi:hypothetical protein
MQETAIPTLRVSATRPLARLAAAAGAAAFLLTTATAVCAQDVAKPETPARAAAPAKPEGALPQVNVNTEKPKAEKPKAQRQVMTQGPNKEPIKIPVSAVGCKNVRAPGKPYFVEFRSRTAVSYGHTFVFYGRLGDGNRFASYKVAGLHPKGDDPNTYLQGMMVPVPSETGASWGDLDEQYLTGRFCVALTEAEYKKMEAYIRQLQATKTTWHATTYNCNAFAADIARHINLDSPNPNMYLPETFIKRMAELNPGGKPAANFGFNFSGMQPPPAAQPAAAPKTKRAQRPAAQPTQQ